MDILGLLKLSLLVMRDWRVIVSTIITVLVIAIANYIVKYTKKAPVEKPKKSAPVQNAPAETESPEETASAE